MIRLSRAQVREIDRRSIEEYRIPGVVLMENAARAVTDVALEMIGADRGQVLILCGGGNNGGDGLAVARHLHNKRINVSIALTVNASSYKNEAKANWDIVQAMKLPVTQASPSWIADQKPILIIDAIFGTGLTSAPRDPFTQIVNAIDGTKSRVLAVDIPSGLDCDTGKHWGACIKADRTVTFVAEKIGFTAAEAKEYLGRVTIGDIGCPRELST